MTKSEFMKKNINDYYKKKWIKEHKEQDINGYIANKNFKLHEFYNI